MISDFLLKNARKIVYALAFAIACATIAVHAKDWNTTTSMSDAFGYLSFSFISLALAVSPIRALFPAWRYNASLYMARRALGVSSFVFAALHYAMNPMLFYRGSLDMFLANSGYGIWVWAGIAAIAVLFLLAATSMDYAVRKLGRRWFTLQKLVYLAYPLIIAHAYTIGIDFIGGQLDIYSGSFLLIAAATVLLEAARIYVSLAKKAAKAMVTP